MQDFSHNRDVKETGRSLNLGSLTHFEELTAADRVVSSGQLGLGISVWASQKTTGAMP